MPFLKPGSGVGYEAVSSTTASVVYATVSGFAERKAKFWFSDYVFVLEVFWTDKKTTFIKRSYDDVLQLCRDLREHYSNTLVIKGLIRSPIFIPTLAGKRLLQKSTIDLAEQRELELQTFFKQLLEGNPVVSSNKIVSEFFSRRPNDPLPSETTDEAPLTDNKDNSGDNDDDDEDILFDR